MFISRSERLFFFYGTLTCFGVLWLPLITFLQPSPYLAATFQFNVWSKSAASLQTALSFLPLGFPTGLPSVTVWGIHESSNSYYMDSPL